MKSKVIFALKLIITIVLGVIVAFFLNAFFSKTGIYCVSNILFGDKTRLEELKELIRASINIHEINVVVAERIKILSIVFSYILAHIVFGPRKTFRFLFKYRWVVGAVLLLFLVISRYNGDSMDAFEYIQNSDGTEYETPVVGFETPERSDETIVSTPRKFYYYSNEMPGTTLTLVHVLKNPIIVACDALVHTVGVDYAYSLDWYFYIILAVLISLEFFMIITNRKQLLSLACTMMIFCSTFYLWWIFPAQLINSMGLVVSFYYCLKTKNNIYRMLLGLSTAIFAIRFVFNLYPAWQVPTAYILLALMVWTIIDRFADIKSYGVKEWTVIGSCVALMFAGLLICYLENKAYISSVTATVYPGERREYGTYTLYKLYNYIPASLFWLKRPEHMSENGIIISLFPLPFILALYNIVKKKKKDILLIGVSLASILLMLYCDNGGLSKTIGDITLLAHATPYRAVDILSYAQVILFARVIALHKIENDVEWEHKKLQKCFALLCGMVFSVYSIHIARLSFGEYMPQSFTLIWSAILLVLAYIILSEISYKKYIVMSLVLVIVSLFTGFIIRPIRKGTDVLYNKPVSKELATIRENEKDTTWITIGSLTSQAYIKASGFDCLNYVNETPNMELWEKIDPQGTYNEVYNRYAHIIVYLTDSDTSCELIQTDAFNLYLSYKDLEKAGVDYIFCHEELSYDNEYFKLQNVYGENGAYIYKVIYK